jgi:hypothetical protein
MKTVLALLAVNGVIGIIFTKFFASMLPHVAMLPLSSSSTFIHLH